MRTQRTRRCGERGQSLVEGLLVLVLLVTIGTGAFAVAVRVVAQVEFESAVANAAASTVGVPRGEDDRIQAAAEDGFLGTLNTHRGIAAGTLRCSVVPASTPQGSRLVTCRGDGSLHLDRVLPIPVPLPLHAEATVLLPAYRQCLPATPATGCGS